MAGAKDLYRQNYPDLLHDYCSEDLDENEWEENEDYLGDEYDNEGIMVPDISRFAGIKQDLKQQEMKLGQKKFASSSSSNKKELK
jgi:hypothetical protein